MKMLHTVVSGLAVGAGLLSLLAAPQTARAQDKAALGAAQTAGPFQVLLIAEPRVGRTRFEARVSRDERAVTEAKVTLNLSMPYHKHGAIVSKLPREQAINVDLEVAAAQYAATVRLPMEGIYEARLIVQSGSEKGIAVYEFTARKRAPVAHLGMWHPAGDFEVRLTTVPEATTAREGPNRFRVQVTRDGVPVTDATVGLTLEMPRMSKMGGPTYTRLAPQDGAYEGVARLHHYGDWQARISVQAGRAKGTAVYDFPAVK